eukprot:5612853-Lingulodinium_polyedra.AAC.1
MFGVLLRPQPVLQCCDPQWLRRIPSVSTQRFPTTARPPVLARAKPFWPAVSSPARCVEGR